MKDGKNNGQTHAKQEVKELLTLICPCQRVFRLEIKIRSDKSNSWIVLFREA